MDQVGFFFLLLTINTKNTYNLPTIYNENKSNPLLQKKKKKNQIHYDQGPNL